MPFNILSLPAELRLRIYDYMLNPSSTRTTSPIHTRINWIGYSEACPIFSKGKAHEIDTATCTCKSTGSPWLPGPPANLTPAVLATCRQIYEEALPRLYEGRLFEAVVFRTLGTQHEALLERWWILERFLASLGSDARQHVKAIRVPLLMSGFETYGCAEAYRSIQSWIPSLSVVEVQTVIVGVMRWGLGEALAQADERPRSLWPLMAFDGAQVTVVPIKQLVSTSYEGDDVVQAEEFLRAQQNKIDAMRALRRSRGRARLENRHFLARDEVEVVTGFNLLWEHQSIP